MAIIKNPLIMMSGASEDELKEWNLTNSSLEKSVDDYSPDTIAPEQELTFEEELQREEACVTKVDIIKDRIRTIAESKGLVIDDIDTPIDVLDKIDNIPNPMYGPLTVEENGVYNAGEENLDGYYKVTVNVPNKLPQVIDKSIDVITASDLQGATSIGYYAFEECRRLTSITLPDSIKTIEHNAFDGCSLLPTMTIPATVTKIDREAFANCTALQTVLMLSSEPAQIDESVFTNTNPNLRIYVPKDSVDKYKSASNWNRYSNRIFASPLQ